MKRLLAGGLGLLWPAVGNACAVCGANADRNAFAFLMMTILLSLLPLAMFAAGGLWLRRRIRQAEARGRVGEGRVIAVEDSALPLAALGPSAEPGRS